MSVLVLAFAAMTVNVFALSPVNVSEMGASLGDYAEYDGLIEEAEMSHVEHVPAREMMSCVTFVASDMLSCLDYGGFRYCSLF